MDMIVTKKISTQLVALLPSTATELPLSHATQVSRKTCGILQNCGLMLAFSPDCWPDKSGTALPRHRTSSHG